MPLVGEGGGRRPPARATTTKARASDKFISVPWWVAARVRVALRVTTTNDGDEVAPAAVSVVPSTASALFGRMQAGIRGGQGVSAVSGLGLDTKLGVGRTGP